MLKIFKIGFAVIGLWIGLTWIVAAAPPQQEPSPQAVFQSMVQQAHGDLEVSWNEKTNIPDFLAGQIPGETTPSADATSTARAFFRRYASLYRMRNPDTELALTRTRQDELGMTHVRFRQELDGVPVWGAEMVVHLAANGRITAVNGEYIPDIAVDVHPTLSMDQALAIVKADLNDATAEFRANRSELTIYARSPEPPALTWKINVFSVNPLGNWLYFVDAHTGSIVHRLNQLDTAKVLRTYDANQGTFLPGTLVCTNSNGTCPAGDTDEQAAHLNASLTYDFYFNTFGRDSFNGTGATLISSVHFSTFYNNAFWDGTQMVYGDGDGVTFIGLARELDVAGHELTHAVTENEAGLIYEDESGALNESYSDVFGTLVEFFGDAANANYNMGEGIFTPAIPGDALRDVANPSNGTAGVWNPATPFGDGQPDHTSLYAFLPLFLDNGGVHINSGIPNKAAYLIAEGGTFHGITVTGIGRSNLAQIYYRTLTLYLTPRSNFINARDSSIQACVDLFGSGHPNCAAVQNGFAAVGIGAPTSATSRIYLPLILSGASCNASGIYGRVTQNGAAAPGIPLTLYRCSTSCVPQLTTTTDGNGCYNLAPPSLTGGDIYGLEFLNSSSVYNNRLYLWASDQISYYTAGANVSAGNFDIADVVLGLPASTTPAPLPRTFNWARRSAAELYQFEMFDLGGANYSAGPEYGQSNYTLTSLPAGFSTFTVYCWDALVYTADGFGVPFFCNFVNFSTTSLQAEPSTGQETQIPMSQVRRPEDFRPW